MTTVLGIDPGAHGAIAVLDEAAAASLLDVLDMPSTPEANGRSATNAPLLAGILARTHARIAFCEFVGARPTDAKVAAFAFGRAPASSRAAPALSASRSCSSRRRPGNGSPTYRPARRTRTWRALGQSPVGLPAPISSPANATSTARRLA